MKTKWNWGTKLLVWIIAFIVFILILVIMTTRSKVNLVEKDYYPKGLVYQNRIDAIENAKKINAVFSINQDSENVIIKIPEIKLDEGTITFFRPSGNTHDRVYNLRFNNTSKMIFPKSEFSKGKYILKFSWNHNNIEYYVEQLLFVN